MAKPRILIADTYYPEVLDDFRRDVDMTSGYAAVLSRLMDLQFGTCDWYARHLHTFGWDTMDVIANFPELQSLWAMEHGFAASSNTIHDQIEHFKPDVIFLQSLSVLGSKLRSDYVGKYIIAGQCSCAIRRDLIQDFNVIFTSFPHFLKQFRHESCKFIYNPLAFEPSVLDTVHPLLTVKGGSYSPGQDIPVENITQVRPYDITFVGGVGNPSHWSMGLDLLTTVAREFGPRFKWWGYGNETIPHLPELQACYQGHAWGREMYQIYSDSKIVLNRHGEISQVYANNMRLYEATGCGALLVTDNKINLNELFRPDEVVAYTSVSHAIERIHHYLADAEHCAAIAARGQRRTLQDHTYYERMKTVSDTLLELL